MHFKTKILYRKSSHLSGLVVETDDVALVNRNSSAEHILIQKIDSEEETIS